MNKQNLGASATRNRCLDESLAEYVVFWDDDVEPEEGCLAAYIRAFHEDPEVSRSDSRPVNLNPKGPGGRPLISSMTPRKTGSLLSGWISWCALM